MMRKLLMTSVVLAAMSTLGCKKTVPNDIIDKTLRSAMSTHFPLTTSAMCGVKVKGLVSSTITVKQKNPDNTGIAHIRGAPWYTPGAPAYCEGDVQFKYTYAQRTTGVRRKTTTTTWYLDQIKLMAVQTPGVKSVSADENNADDDE